MIRHVPIAILLMLLPAAWAEVEWTAPITIDASTAELDTKRHRIDVATDGQGNWYTAWTEKDAAYNPDWDIVFGSISTDNGHTWSERQALAAPGGKWVRMAYSDGVWGILFWGAGWLQKGIYLMRSTDLVHWTSPTRIVDEGPTDYIVASEMELRPVGSTWIVSWEQEPRESADVDAWYIRSADAGLTWSEPALLSPYFAQESGVDRQPTVCGRPDGIWVCVWSSYGGLDGYDLGTDSDLFFSRSTDDGLTWSGAALVDPEYSVSDNPPDAPSNIWFQHHPTLSTDGSLFFLAFVGGSIGIGYSVSKDGLHWTPFDFIGSPTDSPEDQPAATDCLGNWFLTYHSMYEIWGSPLEFSSLGDDLHLEWGTLTLIGSTEGYESIAPRIATDRQGNWVMTWLSRPRPGTGAALSRLVPAGTKTEATMTNVKSASLGASAQMTGVFHWRAME